MAPDSTSVIGRPPGPSRSTIAGILPFGLILRNSRLALLALAEIDRDEFVAEPELPRA